MFYVNILNKNIPYINYGKHISHVPVYFPIHNEDREANRGNMHGDTLGLFQ